LTRATLLVVAPSAPVAWSPGTAPLSETLRARVLAGAGSAAHRAVAVLPASGRRVVAVPVDVAMRRVIGTAAGPRVALHVERPRPDVERPSPAPMTAPWGEPDRVPGVVTRTAVVPPSWVRPPAAIRTSVDTASVDVAAVSTTRHAGLVRPARGRPELRPMPPSVRIRKAAMMAFGLLVSLVAVEAAARVGRR
jgi:hypothetical protein